MFKLCSQPTLLAAVFSVFLICATRAQNLDESETVAPAQTETWRDHFSEPALGPEWRGDRDFFIVKNGVLEGESASPVALSPLHLVEITVDSSELTVGAWVNLVERNNRVCTKGALVLRHNGDNGYVFALHEPTQTIEVFHISTHQMLLIKPAKINLKQWYYLRAELSGATMRFFVDGQFIGSVTDPRAPSGAVGLGVQEAEAVWFDDFSVSGPNVDGNVDENTRPEVDYNQPSEGQVALTFSAMPQHRYYVQVSSTPWTHDWVTVKVFEPRTEPFQAVFTDTSTTAVQFYRVEKVFCNCP